MASEAASNNLRDPWNSTVQSGIYDSGVKSYEELEEKKKRGRYQMLCCVDGILHFSWAECQNGVGVTNDSENKQ